jgi:NADP-reducing hydrogenase subunit HndB
MPKLKLEDLQKLREKLHKSVSLREGGGRVKITVHMGTCGIASGGRQILSAFSKEMEAANIRDVTLATSGCAGLCSREPMATVEIVERPPVKYVDLTEEKVREIFRAHVIGGNIVAKYALAVGSEATDKV